MKTLSASVLAALVIVAALAATAVTLGAQRHRYRRDTTWAQLPPGVTWGEVTAVEVAPDGNIFVLSRCFAKDNNGCIGHDDVAPILKFDTSGKLLKSWGQGMFVFPHGAYVDREGNFWATDSRGVAGKGHQVFKFSGDGRLLMTLGKAGISGNGHDTFNQPTDVVTAPNGDIFVADGHRGSPNSRIVKFSKDGTYIKEWGRKGNGPDDISEPHTIAMDSQGRLFVGDRENNRIKIFDQDGKLLDTWKQFGRPSGIYITKDDTMYVADSESGPDNPGWRKGFRIGSARDGVVTDFIEDIESTTPDHSGAEGVGVDAQGNVYGAVVRRHGLEKHVRER
jgi:sugar lactone lactonase YvrE